MPDDTPSQNLQQAMAKGDIPRAIEILGAMLAATPQDPALHMNMGNVYLAAKNPAAALTHYVSADRLAPRTPLILENIALCYAQTGHTDKAVDFAVQALLIDPTSATTTLLAKILAGSARQAQAAKLFERHAFAKDASPDLLMSFGQLFIQLEQRENALAAYDLGADRRPRKVRENTAAPAPWAQSNPFTADHPSPRYRELIGQYEILHDQAKTAPGQMFEGIIGFAIVAPQIRRFARKIGAKTMLDYGGGRGAQYRLGEIKLGQEKFKNSLAYLGLDQAVCFDPGFKQNVPDGLFDLVICIDALEHCDRQDLPWIIRQLFQKARSGVFANIASYPARKILPNGENAHCTIEEAEWWMGLFRAVAAEFPAVSYQVIVSKDLRQNSHVVFGREATR